MQLRILFIVLICGISLVTGSALAYLGYCYINSTRVPDEPCSSVIQEGKFIDDNMQHYRFNGVVTWWPKVDQLTLFGIKTDSSGSKVFNRTLQLKSITQKGSVLNGRVSELKIAAGDQLADNTFLISEKDRYASLLFKPIDKNNWLLMVNDNWIMMCGYK
jgi:hypothetical protein